MDPLGKDFCGVWLTRRPFSGLTYSANRRYTLLTALTVVKRSPGGSRAARRAPAFTTPSSAERRQHVVTDEFICWRTERSRPDAWRDNAVAKAVSIWLTGGISSSFRPTIKAVFCNHFLWYQPQRSPVSIKHTNEPQSCPGCHVPSWWRRRGARGAHTAAADIFVGARETDRCSSSYL